MHGIASFRAKCCGTTYAGAEGATAFEAHRTGTHGRVRLAPGSDREGWVRGTEPLGARKPKAGPNAPGWRDGRIETPKPWRAPRAPKGGLERLAAAIESGAYDVTMIDDYRDGRPHFRHITTELEIGA